MKHRFYQKSKRQQIAIKMMIAIISLIIILLSILISWKTKYYIISILSISIVLSIIAPFFDTPSLKKSGDLIYYSPLFLAEKPRNGILKIHGGTLFDYLFVLDYQMNGKQRTAFIIQQYLQGLLNIILISNSIAKAKFSIPNLGKIRTFEAELAELTDRKEIIDKLNTKLKNAIV